MAVKLIVSPSPETDDDDDGVPEFYEILETPRSERSVDATIGVQFLIVEESEDEFELIDIRVVPRTNQPNVRIFKQDEETIRIQGTYFDPFIDIFTYVEKGSSDKIESPTTVIGVPNLPPKKDYFDLKQDTREFETVFYDVFVDYKDTLTEELFTERTFITHEIYNEWEGIRTFVTEYYR
jgi:hypothetical protein